jgi:hypothetical protein
VRRQSRRQSASFNSLERLEPRRLLSVSGYEPVNEVGNNLANPSWGTAGVDLVRLAQAAYSNGVSTPSLSNDLSARVISNLLNSQADPSNPSQDLNTLDQQNLSDFGYVFGQFMDHDMDLTLTGSTNFVIPVAAGDPTGPSPLPFTRSVTDPATGTSKPNPLQQTTDVTSYFDLSQVYGSDLATADDLRTMSGGQMKTSPGDMLPLYNSTYFTPSQLASLDAGAGGLQNQNGLPMSDMYATGDPRGNENIELTALQTLFVRNHNRLASELQQMHPTWTDEHLYQEARKLNIAGYQSIIYNEWIPAVLGPNALSAYAGYNPNVNPTIANEFSTVAYRFGHSMVSPTIARDGNNGVTAQPAIPLSLDFFDPTLLNPAGVTDPLTGLVSTDIGAILKGEADGNGQAVDLMAVSSIRNLLFGNFGAGGQDLMALDVQRGRDHGLPDYNTMRVAMGLPAVTSFTQITSNVQVQRELAAAYPGGVNTIDAFEGGLAEDHVAGSDVGPLFQAIMANQFQRLRDGDRFFYLNESFNPSELSLIQQSNSLTKVIEANTNITNLQPDAMVFTASISGTVAAGNPVGRGPVAAAATNSAAGLSVELLDDSGDVLDTTTTDSQGHYSFNNQTGVSNTGYYYVSLVMPTNSSLAAVDTKSQELLISRGSMNMTWNVGLAPKAGSNTTGGGPGAGGPGGPHWNWPGPAGLGAGNGWANGVLNNAWDNGPGNG